MDSEQMERLANIGFRFGPTHVEFETRFLQLAEYKAIHSHTRVPISYTGHDNLGRYVKKTKEQYRAGKLDPARIARLQTIGFNFSRRGDVTPMNNDSTSAAAAAAPTKNKKPAKRSSKKKQKTVGPPPPPPPPSTLPQLVAAAAAAAASEGLPAQATASPSPAEGSPAQETAAITGAQGPTVPAPPAPQNETGLPPETGKASCSTPAAAYAEV
jgi:Helicase associated domain